MVQSLDGRASSMEAGGTVRLALAHVKQSISATFRLRPLNDESVSLSIPKIGLSHRRGFSCSGRCDELDPRGTPLCFLLGPNPSPAWDLNATPFWLENQYEMFPYVSIHVTVNARITRSPVAKTSILERKKKERKATRVITL